MNILKSLLGQKDKPVKSYEDFWNWFKKNEKAFFKTINAQDNIEKNFFDKLSPKLGEIKDGFFYLTGMYDDTTAELILTADGAIRNIAFVEELVAAAPKIDGWKFTALKPALDIKNVAIEMDGYKFNESNLKFYSTDQSEFPDEIDITIVHENYNSEDSQIIINGTFIFLDNFLGELNSVTTIDNVKIIGKEEAIKELIPIAKLKDFLIWREKEFIEKYEGVRNHIEKDTGSILKAETDNGKPLIASVNSSLLEWDAKASHPWILSIEVKFDGKDNNGMPKKETNDKLYELENGIGLQLKDSDGYLNIGRQTADNVRKIYFACRDFRKPSKVMDEIQNSYKDIQDISFEIYKDKYWKSFRRFQVY
jgi:hypothetical protein